MTAEKKTGRKRGATKKPPIKRHNAYKYTRNAPDERGPEWLKHALTRMGHCAPIGSIKFELQAMGATQNRADAVIESASMMLALDPDWQDQMVSGVRKGLSDALGHYEQMIEEAGAKPNNVDEVLRIRKSQNAAYDTLIKLLTRTHQIDIRDVDADGLIFGQYE